MAARSQRFGQAQQAGFFAREIAPLTLKGRKGDTVVDSDEHPRPDTTLEALAKRIGFRTVQGFGERVIFRELYLQGLTLMDVREAGLAIQLGMSHVAARAEVRALIGAIRKPPPSLQLTPPAA